MTTAGRRPAAEASYAPIADHAVIGNQYTTALVTRDANIVWCCFPELADPAVFAALLDHRRGGCFHIVAQGGTATSQAYADLTAVLTTQFAAPEGVLTVTDFMPLHGSIVGCAAPEGPPEIHRIVRCERGKVTVEVEWSPRMDYARATTSIGENGNGFIAQGSDRALSLHGLPEGRIEEAPHGARVRAEFELQEGEARVLVTRYGDAGDDPDLTASELTLRRTEDSWRDWAKAEGTDHDYAWAGDHVDLLLRSAILLKMLTHPESGAIAAAPTTSLPEVIGGIRNWDYRYTWIRDASFTVQALLALGHTTEARDFVEFAERAAMGEAGGEEVLIMYDLHGCVAPDEEELEHLEGYRTSRPVRIGNGARLQVQHDVYGELIDSAYELLRRGGELEPEIMRFLSRLADMACGVWREPDAGIWEMRAEPQHYTYSKLMVWVALDRALRLADEHGLEGDTERWRQHREEIREEILARGYNEQLGAFVIVYDGDELDAANLRMPLLEFLPCADRRVQGTIDRTLEQLTRDGMVYRYKVDDGLPGHEGSFGLCTFWMVQVLALSGRVEEAREIFTGMVHHANHVGLYSEELEPGSGRFLGNFPQAFTHIGFINSLLYLAAAQGIEHPMLRELEGIPSMCAAPGPARAG